MKLHEIKPNILVEHQELGIGQIIETEGSRVVLRFHSNPDETVTVSKAVATGDSLIALPADGLEASFYNNPDEVLSWVDGGPLRLIGATLADLGPERGKTSELQKRLEARLLTDRTWRTWWDDVRGDLQDSKYFYIPKRNFYALKDGVRVEQIPVEPLAAQPNAAGAARPARTRTVANKNKNLAADLKQQSEAYSAGLKQQREGHAADLKQQRQNHAADLKQQREAHAVALKQHQEAYATELERQRESYAADLKQQREAYAADLERKEREAERLRNQLQTLRAEMVAGRQKSNLEVRSGMLLRIGDIIQGTYHLEKSSEARLADVMQRLPMVLNDGGAELFGKVGDAVPYDPKFHHSPETVAAGSPVRLVAPGVIASGGAAGAPVLLKAKVTKKTGDN